MLFEIIAFITSFTLLAYFLWTKNYRFWEVRGVPCLPAEFPWGSLKGVNPFKQNISTFLQSLYNEHVNEPFVGFYGPNEPCLLIKDVNLAKSVLVSDFKSFHMNGFFTYGSVDPMMRYNAFGTQGMDEWKNIRGILSPLFTQSKVKATVPQMTQISKSMVEYIRNHSDEALDTKPIAWKFAIDTVLNIGFGVENDSFRGDKSKQCPIASPDVFLSSPWSSGAASYCSFFIPWAALILRCRFVGGKTMKAVGDWGNSLMEKRKAENIAKVDLIQRLLEKTAKDKRQNNAELSEEEKVAQYISYIMDGSETSATTLTYALYDLARHTDVQEKLRQEIMAVGDRIDDFDGHKIVSLKYLDDCVTESLRLHPAVSVVTRYCTEATTLGTLEIPKGVKVFIPTLSIQTDPKHFPDPLTYNPERFNSQEDAMKHQALFLFGGGPRICLGMRHGQMYVKTGIIALLLNFKIHAVNDLVLDGASFFLNVPEPVYLKFVPF